MDHTLHGFQFVNLRNSQENQRLTIQQTVALHWPWQLFGENNQPLRVGVLLVWGREQPQCMEEREIIFISIDD